MMRQLLFTLLLLTIGLPAFAALQASVDRTQLIKGNRWN